MLAKTASSTPQPNYTLKNSPLHHLWKKAFPRAFYRTWHFIFPAVWKRNYLHGIDFIIREGWSCYLLIIATTEPLFFCSRSLTYFWHSLNVKIDSLMILCFSLFSHFQCRRSRFGAWIVASRATCSGAESHQRWSSDAKSRCWSSWRIRPRTSRSWWTAISPTHFATKRFPIRSSFAPRASVQSPWRCFCPGSSSARVRLVPRILMFKMWEFRLLLSS